MLNIYFNNKISNNSTLSVSDAKLSFSIAWDYIVGSYYTLAIYDIDISDCSLNLLAFNILENNVSASDIKVDYRVPLLSTKESHTFIVDLYIQRDKIKNFDFVEDMELEDSYCSKANKLIFEANLELIDRTTFQVSEIDGL